MIDQLRQTYDEAKMEEENNRWAVFDLSVREQAEKARDEDLQAVKNAREQYKTDQTTALAPFLTPLDDQKALVVTDKATWDAAVTDLAEKQTAANAA